MNGLKGKTILVGKEPGNGRLLVAIQGLGKSAAIGLPGSVPACVSRCKPTEGVAHVKISVDSSGNMIMTNMKPRNVTFVNGSEIVSKRVSLGNIVELGKDHFAVNLPMVIDTAKKIVEVSGSKPSVQPSQPSPATYEKKYSISHLEYVWNDFHDKGLEIRKRQREQGLMSRIPMFFTMGGSALSFGLSFVFGEGNKDAQEIAQIVSGIFLFVGIVIMFYSFLKSKNDTSIEDLENITEDFQNRYVCPNPECNKFLGNLSYRLLKKQYSMHCPYCKCEFVEK